MMKMQIKENQTFTGERAAFKAKGVSFVSCRFEDGESPIKEGKDIEVLSSSFAYKYPLWYGENLIVRSCSFEPSERAGFWYSKNVVVEDSIVEGPKNFRKCAGLAIKRSSFPNAGETLWWNRDVNLEQLEIKNAAYFGMGSKKLTAAHLDLQGDYAFDGSEDIEISDSILHTKDAFWNCERVTLRNCTIIGEYFGWNSQDITLVHCHVESHQGFCYMKNVTLIDCEVVNSDLVFEYCENIDADISNVVDSVKNPISGRIKAKGIAELIQDDPEIDPAKTEYVLP